MYPGIRNVQITCRGGKRHQQQWLSTSLVKKEALGHPFSIRRLTWMTSLSVCTLHAARTMRRTALARTLAFKALSAELRILFSLSFSTFSRTKFETTARKKEKCFITIASTGSCVMKCAFMDVASRKEFQIKRCRRRRQKCLSFQVTLSHLVYRRRCSDAKLLTVLCHSNSDLGTSDNIEHEHRSACRHPT